MGYGSYQAQALLHPHVPCSLKRHLFTSHHLSSSHFILAPLMSFIEDVVLDKRMPNQPQHFSQNPSSYTHSCYHREREREAETQAEGEAGSMHREPDVGFDPGSPGSRPGPKAGAKPLRHPGIPRFYF
ncbi:unnamed protein product [Nyctereutes procyonoides]|uniref:(raccoon dog) hypothetical protein n=1 Tax=Nyctereutes procyonoides TaxID=34880 RepID=A0A811ZFT5_NYCPR|nr:unnamed protein product [Nyctereutes procyonoides]